MNKTQIIIEIPRLRPAGVDEASALGQSVEKFNVLVEELNSELRCIVANANRAATRSTWSTCRHADEVNRWLAAANEYHRRIPQIVAAINTGATLARLVGVAPGPWQTLVDQSAAIANARTVYELSFPRHIKQ